jgi:hypothetical protein
MQILFASRNGAISAEFSRSTAGPTITGDGAKPPHRAVISPQLIVKAGSPLIATALAASSTCGGNVRHPLIDGSRSVGNGVYLIKLFARAIRTKGTRTRYP